MNLFNELSFETSSLLKKLPGIIDKVFPLPARFRNKLKYDVAELSALFTSNRPEKKTSYLGKPNLLSAYLRYFLPWNVYRLCRLLPSLSIKLKNTDAVLDLGAGPLSFATALWISRPDLRKLNLEFRCVDHTSAVMDTGKKILYAMSAETDSSAKPGNWNIKTIQSEIQRTKLPLKIYGKPAAFVSAINFYNEIYWNYSPADKTSLDRLAGSSANLLSSLCADKGQILVVEPGIPRSGEFISLLRGKMIEKGLGVLAPCPHEKECPYPGAKTLTKQKAKWCHFSFETESAPLQLKKLSEASGLPKPRAVLNFLFAEKKPPIKQITQEQQNEGKKTFNQTFINARVLSDAFPIGDNYARYCCSEIGTVLLTGSSETVGVLPSGSLAQVNITNKKDPKTGFVIAVLP